MSLCICDIPSWDELKVQQKLFASDYEIYMVMSPSLSNGLLTWFTFLSPPFTGINHYNL